MKFNSLKICTILLYLIPPTLVVGPFLPDFFLSIISIIFIINCFYRRSFSYFKFKFFYFFIFFWILINLSSLTSVVLLDSFKSSFFFIRFGIFSLAVVWILENNQEIFKNLLKIFITIYIILFIDSNIQFIFLENIINLPIREDNRISSFFGKELIMGSYIVRFLPFVICLYLVEKFKKKYLFFLIFLSNIIIIYSGERVSFFFIIILNFLFILRLYHLKKSIILLFILFTLISFFIIINKDLYNRLVVYTKTQLSYAPYEIEYQKNKFESSYPKYIFSKQHQGHIEVAINIFLENPWLGAGIKSFRNLCNKIQFNKDLILDYCSTHPHNIYIQLLAENGIFVFTFVISLWIFLLIKLLKLFFNKSLYNLPMYALLSGFCVNLFPLVPSGNIFNNYLCVIMFYPVGFFLYFQNKTKNAS